VMRLLLPFCCLSLLAGCTPKNIVHSSCESEMLATGDPWRCTLSGEVVEQASSIEFDTESRNRLAEVQIALRVRQGPLRLGYRDLRGEQHVLVTPDTPLALSLQTRLRPEARSFTLYFEPLAGKAEGLLGTVRYTTP
jgi:hypothetical protein